VQLFVETVFELQQKSVIMETLQDVLLAVSQIKGILAVVRSAELLFVQQHVETVSEQGMKSAITARKTDVCLVLHLITDTHALEQ